MPSTAEAGTLLGETEAAISSASDAMPKLAYSRNVAFREGLPAGRSPWRG